MRQRVRKARGLYNQLLDEKFDYGTRKAQSPNTWLRANAWEVSLVFSLWWWSNFSTRSEKTTWITAKLDDGLDGDIRSSFYRRTCPEHFILILQGNLSYLLWSILLLHRQLAFLNQQIFSFRGKTILRIN